MNYRIGTRGSKLAMIQATAVRDRLAASYPDDSFELVVIRTRGDADTTRPIAEIGDSALFTREIELALVERRVDLAVHSMKDLAAECPEGLVLAKAWTREDPRDVLVACAGIRSFDELPQGATVATGSVRRDALLRRRRPDLNIVGLRGNVDTRLRKLFEPRADEPKLDAIILAAAGLKRLGREEVMTEYLDPAWMIPAANQGQLAIELRSDDPDLKAKIDALGDDAAEAVAFAERAFLKETGLDCRRPVGALARLEGGRLVLDGVSGTSVDDLKVEHRTAGVVTLVGAGPGDPELITVKGLKALQTADAVVYDRLVSDDLLKEIPPDCERLYVGKASGHHTLSQTAINARLAELAIRHENVVRLKGGDPFVFGRGGEEMAFLTAHGIRCRVIPGVTSAIAAASSMRIPITHREVASGFEVVTAHAKDDEPLKIDFARMLDDRVTYVFLMGLARVGEIVTSLRAAGKRPETPVAVVSSATTPAQRGVFGTLADICERLRSSALPSPAVFVVGDVVKLPPSLGFPLAGRRYLVPVLEGGSMRLGARLRALGATVDEVTVGRIAKIDGAVNARDFDGIDRIILTSKNGWLGLDERLLAAAKARGIRIEEVREVRPDGRTLHLTQPDADRVEGVRAIDVYRNEVVEFEGPINLSHYDGALFTCASSVRRIFAQASGETHTYAIGAKTAAALKAVGVQDISIANSTTVAAMVNAVEAASVGVCPRSYSRSCPNHA